MLFLFLWTHVSGGDYFLTETTMSVQFTSLVQTRGLQFSLPICLAALLLLVPSFVNADTNTLPFGILDRQACGSFSVDIYGYGAGMMQNTNPIEVTDQRVTYISATENCAVVQWESSNPAATQVIFAELGDEPIAIDTSIDPNFGYPQASTQNNAGIAQHTAILTGLEAGKAYSYRVVTRAHPSALPTISDPQVFIAGPYTTPTAQTVPTTSPTAPIPSFDTQKPPVTPTVTTKPVTVAPSVIETEKKEDEEEVTVPAAITAAAAALGTTSQEGALWQAIKGFFNRITPDINRLSLSSNIGLFEKDRYIIPTLLFLAILFLIQHLVLPTLSISLKNPLLYWLVGSIVLAVLSSVFMLYYITLVSIALFLGILAWYLLKNISYEDGVHAGPKLLETIGADKKSSMKKKDTK
ncbi:MAG: hypothetical protein CMI56_00520 [Parcubacteria group bacterium]|nr:hypothetical protein [Parcubacteria group bacterium]|tara:strand:+ start:5520 stop:6749 length:1230 start_codon:yes stop_codon:yes gene_type:complete